MLASLALWPMEQLLNQLLRNDPHIRQQLRPFAGKTIAITAHSPRLDLLVTFNGDSIQLAGQHADALGIKPDATLSGQSSDLAKLLMADPHKQALANPELHFSGDVHLIQDLYQTLEKLDLRWDDYLAPVLGDVITEQGSRVQKEGQQWFNESRQRLRNNVEDYLKEEAHLLPHEEDLRQFSDGLDTLKLQLDRAEARLRSVQSRLDKLSN